MKGKIALLILSAHLATSNPEVTAKAFDILKVDPLRIPTELLVGPPYDQPDIEERTAALLELFYFDSLCMRTSRWSPPPNRLKTLWSEAHDFGSCRLMTHVAVINFPNWYVELALDDITPAIVKLPN